MGVASNIELLIFDGATPLVQPPAQASVVALAGALSGVRQDVRLRS